jgi:hypothetical protein
MDHRDEGSNDRKRSLFTKILLNFLYGLLIIIIASLVIGIASRVTSREVRDWDDKLRSSMPVELEEMGPEREQLLGSFDEFILASSGNRLRTTIQLMLLDPSKLQASVRKRLLTEIPGTHVDEGKLYLWYVYNMGVIAKTSEHTICFDIDSPSFDPAMISLGKLCDIQTVSHVHTDHSDTFALVGTLRSGGTIVLHGNYGGTEDFAESVTPEEYKENIVHIDSREEKAIGDVTVQCVVTTHRMEPEPENCWFTVSMDGFTLVHTGDGNLNGIPFWDDAGEVDVFLANEFLVPFDLRDSRARYIVPLHISEIAHDRSFLEDSSYTKYLSRADEIQSEFDKVGSDSDVYLLLWGEHLEIDKAD